MPAPLLIVAMWLTPSHTHAWAVAFYSLAMIFNYPHFMATIYRAYHTRQNFERYKIVTLHVTLLVVLTGIMLHASYRLLPWVYHPVHLLEPVALLRAKLRTADDVRAAQRRQSCASRAPLDTRSLRSFLPDAFGQL